MWRERARRWTEREGEGERARRWTERETKHTLELTCVRGNECPPSCVTTDRSRPAASRRARASSLCDVSAATRAWSLRPPPDAMVSAKKASSESPEDGLVAFMPLLAFALLPPNVLSFSTRITRAPRSRADSAAAQGGAIECEHAESGRRPIPSDAIHCAIYIAARC